MRRWGTQHPARDVRQAVRRLLELSEMRQLLPAPAARAHRADGGPLQRVRTPHHAVDFPRTAPVYPLPQYEVSREERKRSQVREGRSEEGTEETQAESETRGDRRGRPDRLGRRHEPDELLQGPGLHRVVRPLLLADRRKRLRSVVVAGAHAEGVVHLPDAVEQGIVHLLDARTGKVDASAIPDE